MPRYKLTYKVYGKTQVLDFEELSDATMASVNMLETLSGSPQMIMSNNAMVLDKEDLLNEWINSRKTHGKITDSVPSQSTKAGYAREKRAICNASGHSTKE
jgi:hypothetical protein